MSDLRPIDILTVEIAIEVTGVVGVSPALWYFKVHSEHIFDSTQAPVLHVFAACNTRCRFKSIPFGKYRRYSITFGYYNDSFWKLWHI